MNLITKVIFTTNEVIYNFLLEKFDSKKVIDNWFKVFTTKIEIEYEDENIILVFSPVDLIEKSLSYVIENYVPIKFLNVWTSKIIRNQDLLLWDIVLPNSFMDKAWEDAIFLDYAVWENYDMNSFGLILNWFSMEERFYASDERLEYLRQELSIDLVDEDSYKFLKTVWQQQEDSVVIRLCLNKEENINNHLLENLVNILEIMI